MFHGSCPLEWLDPPSLFPNYCMVGGPRGHLVVSVPVDQNSLDPVGAMGFLVRALASTHGGRVARTQHTRFCKPEIVYDQAEAGRKEGMAPGMQEECLGGLSSPPPAPAPQGNEYRPQAYHG